MSNTDDLHSLSHTKWNCKYHIVFAPKYRRKEFYDARRLEIGKIRRDLSEWKGVNIVDRYNESFSSIHPYIQLVCIQNLSLYNLLIDFLK